MSSQKMEGSITGSCVQEREIMQRFGFLYGGYSFQYWETVDMMRKLIIGAIPVFVAVQPLGSLQAIIGEVECLLSPCTSANSETVDIAGSSWHTVSHVKACILSCAFSVTRR